MSGPGWDFSQYVDDGQGGQGRPPGPPPGGNAPGPYPPPPAFPGPSAFPNQSGPSAFPGPSGPAAFPGSSGPSGPFAGPGLLTTDRYGIPDGAPLAFSPGRPPVIWLALCAAAAVAGGVLALLLGATPMWAVIAWVISGPLAIGLLAAFSSFDTRQRAKGLYSGAEWVRPAYWACLVLCLLAVAGSALRIAFWVGRL